MITAGIKAEPGADVTRAPWSPEADLFGKRDAAPTHCYDTLRLNGFGPPFLDRFATVSDRFSGSWCRFLESWGQDGEDGEKTGKNDVKWARNGLKKVGPMTD